MKKTLLALLVFPFFADAQEKAISETGVASAVYYLGNVSPPPLAPQTEPTVTFKHSFYGKELEFAEEKNKDDRSAGVSEVSTIFHHLDQQMTGLKKQMNEVNNLSLQLGELRQYTEDNIGTQMNDIQSGHLAFMEEAQKVQNNVDKLSEQMDGYQKNMDSAVNETLEKAMPDYIDQVLPAKIGQYIPGIQKDVLDKQIAEVTAEHTSSLNTKVDGLKNSLDSAEKRIAGNESATSANYGLIKKNDTNIQQNEALLESAKVVTSVIADATLALEADVAKMDIRISNASKKANTASNVANQNTRHVAEQKVKVEKNTLDILKNRQDLRSLENDLRETNERLDNGLAASAALNGLFQPYGVGKLNITAAVGGYQSTQAVAVGTGYRFNENIAVKTGVAYTGSNDMMYNMAVNLEW